MGTDLVKVVVTGATGLLGAHITAALQPTADVTGVDRHPWWGAQPLRMVECDLADERAIDPLIRDARPDVVFHCAALVNVDACEQSPAAAHAVNAELPGRLARAAGPSCLFVYITTDGIFRGESRLAAEDTVPEPRTVYGRSKLQGEREVAAATANHLILRTNFFGWSSGRKQTFAEWLYGALEHQAKITLFDDFYFTPIYVVDFVAAVLGLMDRDARGLFHLAGGERVSKYAFGMEVAAEAGLSTVAVTRGSIDDAHLAAPRPKDMSLSTARAAAVLGRPLPDCRAGISRFLADCRVSLDVRAARAVQGRHRR